MALTDDDKHMLRMLRDLYAKYPCDSASRAERHVADGVRMGAPDVPDAELSKAVLTVALAVSVAARESGMSPSQIAGFLGGVAVELAELELDEAA